MVVASTGVGWGGGYSGKVWTGASGKSRTLSSYKPHPDICQPDEGPTFL